MFPKALQNRSVLSVPLTLSLILLTPHLVESTTQVHSGIGRQAPLPNQVSLQTKDMVGSSIGTAGIQDYSPPEQEGKVSESARDHLPPNSRPLGSLGTISNQDQQMLNEIRQLRSQGDGLNRTFNRDALNQQSQQIFDEELARLVQQEKYRPDNSKLEPSSHQWIDRNPFQPEARSDYGNGKPSMLAPMNSNDQFHEHRNHNLRNNQLRPQEVGNRIATPSFENHPRARIEEQRSERPASLRSMARRLDQIAADLEEAQMYGQADEIRATAHELWKAARNFRGDGPHRQNPVMPESGRFNER